MVELTKNKKRSLIALLLLAVAAVFLFVYPDAKKQKYFCNQGQVFGTYYNIRYSADKDLQTGIMEQLQMVDNSLSTFNPNSVISLINTNENNETDSLFEIVYEVADKVARMTNGAFDITVAPLVNAWGFGFKNMDNVSEQMIDSIRQFVGYEAVSLFEHRLYKADERTMLDASAIAKGFGCDVVANYLKEQGCENYLVDIGGEVVCHGVNDKGDFWSVGITKPIDDTTGTQNELQDIVQAADLAMATSGNYRQFYYDGNERRSHTIDPRTGYPVKHNLLSATIVAENCMTADALATACMVLGKDEAIKLIQNTPNTACYLIYATDNGMEIAEEKFGDLIKKQ